MSNRVDVHVTPQVVTTVKTALIAFKAALPPLVTVADEERSTLPKMGDKTQAFVGKALITAQNHPEILPGKFDLAAFQTDVELIDALTPIWAEMRELFAALDDTLLLAGSEAFSAALEVYQYAKLNDQEGELGDALKDMGERFSRKPYKKAVG